MKKILPLLLILLTGCRGEDPAMAAALELRSRCLASAVSFEAEIVADYITTLEEFELQCTAEATGELRFRVLEPEDIADISGTVSGTEGAIAFDDTILPFPLMAEGRLSPVSAPWVMMQALRSGNILAVGYEEELLHLTIDDSYESNALTVDLWVGEGKVEAAEIAWEGRRQIAMTIDGFRA